MNLFKDLFSERSGFKSSQEAIGNNTSPVSVTGLSHIHRAQLAAALGGEKINLVVTSTEAEARRLCDDINMMSGRNEAVVFPSKELVLTPVDSSNHEYEYMRIAALAKAAKNECTTVCASIEAVMQPVIPCNVLISAGITLTQGQETDLTKLCAELTRNGYQRCEKVEGASQFSVRGSILDIYPVQADRPVRLEFWGDEIDSISEFETETQRRTEPVESIDIPPAS